MIGSWLRWWSGAAIYVLLLTAPATAQVVSGFTVKGELDSTGTELNDTTNHWKKVSVNNKIQIQDFTYTNINTNVNTSLKTSAGVLSRIIINKVGAASNTITIKDSAAADCSGGATIGIISSGSGALGTVLSPIQLDYLATTINGLCISTATGTAPDITVMWR